MSDKEQVNVKIDSERKDRWEDYKDQSMEVSSMSDLVRLSVEKELSGLEGGSGDNSDNAQLGEIASTLKDIQSDIGQLDKRLSRVETSTQENPELDKLANEVFPLLPDEEPGTRAWEEQLTDFQDELEAIEAGHTEGDRENVVQSLAGWKGTPEAIAEALDVSELDSRKALERLVSDMSGRVRTTDHAGEERYWRDV